MIKKVPVTNGTKKGQRNSPGDGYCSFPALVETKYPNEYELLNHY